MRDNKRCLWAGTLPFYMILAMILTLCGESVSRASLVQGFLFVWEHTLPFLFNAGIVLLTLLPCVCLKRRIFSTVLISFIWMALHITDSLLRVISFKPFTGYDLILFVENFTIANSYVSPMDIVLIIAAVVLLIVGLVFLFHHAPKHKPQYGVLWAILSLAVIIGVCSFPFARTHHDYENMIHGYQNYGFAYSFIRSSFDRKVDRPEEYGETAMNVIRDEIDVNPTPVAENASSPNIIILQLESFIDPSIVQGVTCSENPVPTFSSLKETCSTGLLYVPTIGGGTANVEFEVLCGMNLDDFGTGEYPYSSLLKETPCESIAHILRRHGYTAQAVHNHTATFYRRNIVYSMLGFDTFIPLEYMTDISTNDHGWCCDSVLTGNIMDALRSTHSRDFIFTVSVQGHGKYKTDAPEIPYTITTTGLEGNESLKNSFEYYINQIHETDAFVADLLTELKSFEEPTILVIYGDHLPALNFDDSSLVNGLMTTEYIIWSNDESLNRQQKDLTAYQLSANVLERCGICDGILISYHQTRMDKDDYEEGLRLLEYDLLYGDSLLYSGEDSPYHPTDMRMGAKQITIDSASYDGTRLVVRGKNFTRFSTVYADSQALETTYIDKCTLVAESTLLSRIEVGSEIHVSQVASDGFVLGQSSSVTVVAEK